MSFLFGLAGLHLYGVESLAVNTDDRALAHESLRVDHLYEPEYGDALALLGQQAYHLHLLAAVPSVAVEQRQAVVGLARYGAGNVFVVLREDEELHRLALHAHHIVEHQALDDHRAEAEHHHLATVEHVAERRDEEAAANDAQVDHDEHAAERYVAVLVDRRRHDVGAARAAVVQEHNGEGRAREHAPDDERHEVVAVAHELVERAVGHHHHLLGHLKQEREHERGVDGFH